MTTIKVEGKLIGASHPCFIIAEAGVNHNGDMQMAHRLIDEAFAAGANAVKFQSFVTEELITAQAPKARYQIETTGMSGSQYSMLKALELTDGEQLELKNHCDSIGIIYICTPYEQISVDMLDDIGVAAFKVASTDITNLPFLHYIARKGRPVILSTGMCTLGEVEEAVNTLIHNGLMGSLALLQCTSEYPAPFDEVNLKAIHTMEKAFRCPVGFSDHTPGVGASPWAVAIGACIIEKHFTLDRNLPGPDHRASIEPSELLELVHTIRNVESALGNGIKQPSNSEIPNKQTMQKSLVARHYISAGQVITENDLTAKRPATGIPPAWLGRIAGKCARLEIAQDEILQLSHILWDES